MPSCADPYCRNSTKNYETADGKRLSFHRFPRVATVRQLWLENLQREGFEPKSRSVLCSEHFEDSCFDGKSIKYQYPRLHYGAVPTLFVREGPVKKVEHEQDEEESSDEEPESWSGWHSWQEKEGSMDEDGQNDASKGLEELEELMEEEMEGEMEEEMDEEEEDLNEERGGTEDWIEDEGDGKGASNDENGAVMVPQEEEEAETEIETDADVVRKALERVGDHDRITLDNVTMDPSLTSVRVGDQRMVSMTFQDILNSLIPAQSKDSPPEPKKTIRIADKVKGHLVKVQHDTVHQSQGLDTVQRDGAGQSSKATPQTIITPGFKELLKRRNEATQKTKHKDAKKKDRDRRMVISIYRKNTMMRIITAKDLPYICGDCGLAFTHASMLKNHVETKHDYTEPIEMKGNGEFVSQVVIHRDFEKENLKTKAQVKELHKKYAKAESGNVTGGSEPAERWFEKVDRSSISFSGSDGDGRSLIGNSGGDSDVDNGLVEVADSHRKKKSKKKKRKQKQNLNQKTDGVRNAASGRKHKDRCHRCPRYFTSLSQRKQHVAEVHGEYASQEVAQESWNKTTDGSSTLEVLKCIYCDTFFTDQENAEGHLNKHCGLDGIKCEVCEEAIKIWNEGRNMELGNLLKRYDGAQEEGQDGDDVQTKKTEGGEGAAGDDERKGGEESTVNDDRKGKQDAEDLIRRSLERANKISNKHFFIVTCFECNEQYFLRHHLVNHYKTHAKFTCKECGEEFKTMTQYQEHLDEVHKVGMCPCLYCPNKFPSLGKLNFHMLGHLGLFQCIVCGMTLMSKQSLETHIRGAANDANHKACSDAERVTYSSSNPFLGSGQNGRRAGWRRGTKKIKDIACKFCDRKFGYAHNLRKHMRFLHPNEEVPMNGDGFCCERCGVVLATKSSFKMHLKTHQERTISCPKPGCKAMFNTKMNLNSHLRTHGQASWSRMFKCEICEGTYKTKHYLEMHMKYHSGQEPYACSYCGKTFRNVTHMVYHERRMHTGQLDHTCEVCGKGFADPSTLKVHLRTHSTHRPFVCDFCSKDFPTELYLRAHRRIHTKPFKCSQCGEGFSQQAARRNHLRKSHGIEMPVDKTKYKGSAQDETEQSSEDVTQMAVASIQNIDVTETLVISDSNEDKEEMISELLASIY